MKKGHAARHVPPIILYHMPFTKQNATNRLSPELPSSIRKDSPPRTSARRENQEEGFDKVKSL